MPQLYTQPGEFWRERDFGQKISATFEFIGVHWRTLGRILLYLVVPAALVQSIIAAFMQSQLLATMRHSLSGADATSRLAMYGTTFTSPLYYLSNVASVAFHTILILSVYGYLYLCLYPLVEGAAIAPADVWAIVKRKFVSTFFSLYGVGLLVIFGLFVLAIPGIYLSVVLSLFFIVSMVEDSGFGATISRCVALTKGKWWSTFGLIFVMVLLLYLLLIGFGIVIGILSTVLRGSFPMLTQGSAVFSIIVSALSTLIVLLLYPPILLAMAFQYFNLVERHEGVGMRHMVDQLGQAAPLAGPNAITYRPDEDGEY